MGGSAATLYPHLLAPTIDRVSVGMAFDLFGEIGPDLRPIPETKRAHHRYQVRVTWLSAGNELLAQESRPLTYGAAVKLWGRVLRGDSDVLDAELFNAETAPAIPDGVRLLSRLLKPAEIVSIDRDLFGE